MLLSQHTLFCGERGFKMLCAAWLMRLEGLGCGFKLVLIPFRIGLNSEWIRGFTSNEWKAAKIDGLVCRVLRNRKLIGKVPRWIGFSCSLSDIPDKPLTKSQPTALQHLPFPEASAISAEKRNAKCRKPWNRYRYTDALADTLLQFQQQQLLLCPTAVIAAFQMTFKYFPQSHKLSGNME